MANNIQGVVTSFKRDLLQGTHAFGTTVNRTSTIPDTFKVALFYTQQGLGSATTAYGNITTTLPESTIIGTTLTVTGTVTGYVTPGIILTGSGVTAGTHIVSQISGTTGAGDGATYSVSKSQTVASTTITSTGELSGTNYVAGGITITNVTPPSTSGTTAFWTPSANFIWNNLTSNGIFDTALIYNDTAVGKNAVSVHTFGPQNVTSGTFILTMPPSTVDTALIII